MSKSSSIMRKTSSEEVAKENYRYVYDRMKGNISSLKTKFPKFNSCLMGGLELDTILCISAMSGAGKSTLSKCIRDSITDLNKDQKFKQYIFNFEMVSHQQVARSIVSETGMSLKTLYSVDTPLEEDTFKSLKDIYRELSERDIDFIDVSASPKKIADSILYYWLHECKPHDKAIIYEIDHALLVKGASGQSEKERIDELMLLLVDVKKYIASNGGHSIGIVLSQMNREIKAVHRVQNSDMHRPDTSCLFGASSIEQCSDYILFSHIPAKLGIQKYTTHNLPTRYKIDGEVDNYQMVYFEIVKNRSGQSDLTIPVYNKLATFDFEEMETSTFEALMSQEETIPVIM